ncbi:MAG TPA: hypothetical protein VHK27_09425 [Gammaproteobacteria bacterium]|nr:hypothetical protein [Gammaproteobacteria bacterium]
MKFTVRGIEALKLKTKRYDVLESDSHGFGIRVAPSGRHPYPKVMAMIPRHRSDWP